MSSERSRAAAARTRLPPWTRRSRPRAGRGQVLLVEQIGAGNVFGSTARGGICGTPAAASVPDGKGMHDLALLLAVPGRSVPVGELLGFAAPGADDMLDATARAAYKARLTDLETQIDEAAEVGDLGRAERARTEREFLIHELAAATGLGARVHPELGEHLEASIHTGTQCSYQPSGPIGWEL